MRRGKLIKVCVFGVRGFPGIQGGVEKHCEELYPRLAKLGCDITVFNRTPYFAKWAITDRWKEVKFIRLWCPRNKYMEAITHSFLAAMVSIFKRPDIVHIHNIGPALMLPFLKMAGLKAIVTYHSSNYQHEKWGRISKQVLKTGELLGAKFSDNMIVISKGIRELVEKKYKRRDLHLIHNGVDLPEIVSPGETLSKYRLTPGQYVFAACRFVPEKGLHDLINAYHKIGSRQLKLVIAGDADHETEYSRIIKKLAKEREGIVLTGFISGKPLAELFSNAGLFVLPSYYEGLPIALLEALSYGIPALVSDIPANREVQLPDFRFFPPRSIEILSQKMVELLKNGISQKEKKKNEELLAENYNWDVIAQKTHSIYASMIS